MKKYAQMIGAVGLMAGMLVFSGCGDDDTYNSGSSTTTTAAGTTTTTASGTTTTTAAATTTTTAAATTTTTAAATTTTTSTVTTTTVPVGINVEVLGANTTPDDASTGNKVYNITLGNYTFNIAGFGTGDTLNFPEGNTPTITNTNFTDGIIDVKLAVSGQVVLMHLTGLTTEQDGSVYSLNTFKAVFGANSIQ